MNFNRFYAKSPNFATEYYLQTYQTISPQEIQETIETLHREGSIFPFTGLPDSQDFPSWKLELTKNGARSVMTFNVRNQAQARMEGNRHYGCQAVALGRIDATEGAQYPNHHLTIAPVFFDPEAYTPKASAPIRLTTFTNSIVAKIVKAQILACQVDEEIACWETFLEKNVLPPATEKELALTVRKAYEKIEN